MNGGCKPLRWWTSFKQTFCLVGLLNIWNVFPRFFPRFLSGWSKAYLIRKTCWSLIEDIYVNVNSPCWWWNHARIPHTFSSWITMFVDDLDIFLLMGSYRLTPLLCLSNPPFCWFNTNVCSSDHGIRVFFDSVSMFVDLPSGSLSHSYGKWPFISSC